MDVTIVGDQVIWPEIVELQEITPDQRLVATTLVNKATQPRIAKRLVVELMDTRDKLVWMPSFRKD